ncbi:peptidase S8/S53 domain-containing protein [Lactarius quietus]|nr:peptidase S8/S53 domain-containing protein [Lactarius quietus]
MRRNYWLELFVLPASLTSLATVLASPWNDTYVQHRWDVAPGNWELIGPPDVGSTIDLRIALKPHREHALVEALYDVSSPGHPKHVFHHSSMNALIVTTCLKTRSLSLLRPTQILSTCYVLARKPRNPLFFPLDDTRGSWLKATSVPVYLANKLLDASYQLYRHAGTNDTILRTMNYSLPVTLQDYVATVVPTTYFGVPRTLRKTPRIPDGAAARAPPGHAVQLLRLSPQRDGQERIRNFGLQRISPSPTDLTLFMEQFVSNGTNATYKVVQIKGGAYEPSQPNDQEDFNVQFAAGITHPTPIIFYSTGGYPPFNSDDSTPTDSNEPFLDWLDYMLDEPNLPQTITIGYGDNEETVPYEYARTVLVASGDAGVGMGDCVVNDGSGAVQFLPTFPASCPHVTSVGGTTQAYPEVAADSSGGGFSNFFERPSYQDSSVSAFLANLGSQYKDLYSPVGRAYPDVAAQYYNYTSVLNGTVGHSAGSSAATTLVLNDITSGSNPGCNTNGFSAGVGWDPVTGLGTPNFGAMQLLLSNKSPG